MRSNKLMAASLVFVVLLTSGSSCRSKVDVPNNIPIRIGVFPKGLQAPIYLIAKKHHFLENHGLQPTFYEFGLLPAMTQAFIGGQTDVIWVGITQVADMSNKGVPVRLVLAHANATERVLVQANSKISSITELKGKKVGTPGEGTTAHTLFRIVAKNMYGLNPDKDFTFIKASEDNLSRLLTLGEIDAAILKIETFATMEENKARVISVLSDEWKKHTGNGIPFVLLSSTFQQKYISEHRDAVSKYILAMKEANDYALSHQEEVIELLAQQFSMSPDAARKYLGDWKDTYFCDLSDPVRQTIVREWEAMVAAGDLTAVPNDVFEVFPEARDSTDKVPKKAQ